MDTSTTAGYDAYWLSLEGQLNGVRIPCASDLTTEQANALDTMKDAILAAEAAAVAAVLVADAGDDQNTTSPVDLDGSGSTGDIVSWVWWENNVEIATGETPQNVVFGVGVHTVVLVVVNEDFDTATDTVVITVT